MMWNTKFGPFAMAICIVIDTLAGIAITFYGIVQLIIGDLYTIPYALLWLILGVALLLNIYVFFSLAQDTIPNKYSNHKKSI